MLAHTLCSYVDVWISVQLSDAHNFYVHIYNVYVTVSAKTVPIGTTIEIHFMA